MVRRALLIGAETDGLTGVGNDVTAIAEALDGRGFVIDRREAADATRAGILDGYEALIAGAAPDDVVLLYYSGHGGYVRPVPDSSQPSPASPAPSGMDLQFIVPTDYEQSTEDDFRGITAVELSVLQARLTQVTQNVVVVLDCCHAAHMSRDGDIRVKALSRPAHLTYDAIARHLATLRERGLRVDQRDPVGNKDAVRVVACAPEQSAYEYTNQSGVRIGMFTESLTLALAEARDLPLTWFTLLESVRRRVLRLAPNQRPEVEGPSRRLLFDTREAEPITALPVVPVGPGRVNLPGARLLNVEVGDEFVILPTEAPAAEAASLAEAAGVGSARVDRAGALTVQAELQLRAPWTEVPIGARAYRTRAAAPALPVRVPRADPRGATLVTAMAASTLVRVADPDEPEAVEVRIDPAGRYVVADAFGALHEPRPATQAGVRTVVADLERVARASALRNLSEDPRYALDQPLTIEWGKVASGTRIPLERAGALVHAGEIVYVRIRNDGDATVYVSLVDIGVSARIAVLTDFAPSGIRLPPGREYELGFDDLDGVLRGVPVTWPPGLPAAPGRPETILVLATSAPQDIGLLQQEGIRGRARTTWSPLERILDQVASGGVRDVAKDSGPSVRYAVRTIDFSLSPAPPPTAETARFLIDERPDPSMRLLAARGLRPTTVAVRLEELVVHRNRALRSADIRVDAVVSTGGDDPGMPIYRAQTERFANVRDGDRLPLDRMLVYHGPAVDYLDLAVWVTRDTAGSLALSDLLRDQLGSQEFQAAGVQLATLAVAAPQATAAVAAVGAGALVVNVAYRLLLDVVGSSIGLYRTSLLAGEGFGVGRHPTKGHLRAQDFSFSFTVDAVG